VEVERARISRILAGIHEDQGKISDAASVLQELQACSYQNDRNPGIEFLIPASEIKKFVVLGFWFWDLA